MAETDRFFELYMEEYRRRYADGDNLALLEAADHCHSTGRALPADLATAHCTRFGSWRRDQVRTLDEAFGVERPKGQHFDELKKRSCDRMDVLNCAMRLRQTKNLPVGGEMFMAIAEELGLTERYVRERFYDEEIGPLRQYLLKQYKVPRKRPVSR
jgi:hypothetical protein